MTDFYTKLNADYYKTALPYPSKPSEPAILRSKVKDLSADELASIPAVKATYEAALAAYSAAREAYRADEGRLYGEFRKDMAEYHGMTGHPKEEKVYALAYERGHSAGYSEVANYYSDYADLVK